MIFQRFKILIFVLSLPFFIAFSFFFVFSFLKIIQPFKEKPIKQPPELISTTTLEKEIIPTSTIQTSTTQTIEKAQEDKVIIDRLVTDQTNENGSIFNFEFIYFTKQDDIYDRNLEIIVKNKKSGELIYQSNIFISAPGFDLKENLHFFDLDKNGFIDFTINPSGAGTGTLFLFDPNINTFNHYELSNPIFIVESSAVHEYIRGGFYGTQWNDYIAINGKLKQVREEYQSSGIYGPEKIKELKNDQLVTIKDRYFENKDDKCLIMDREFIDNELKPIRIIEYYDPDGSFCEEVKFSGLHESPFIRIPLAIKELKDGQFVITEESFIELQSGKCLRTDRKLINDKLRVYKIYEYSYDWERECNNEIPCGEKLCKKLMLYLEIDKDAFFPVFDIHERKISDKPISPIYDYLIELQPNKCIFIERKLIDNELKPVQIKEFSYNWEEKCKDETYEPNRTHCGQYACENFIFQ